MKAAYIEKPGPPENIIYGNLPKPKLADNQVLVKVKAVALWHALAFNFLRMINLGVLTV